MNFSVAGGLLLWEETDVSEETPGKCLEVDDRTNALTFVHQLESLVDLLQAHGMGDELVQRNLPLLELSNVAR
ncbi:hypothetical protein D3C75_1359950 [compost metagenome]